MGSPASAPFVGAMFCSGSGNVVHAHLGGLSSVCGLPIAPGSRVHLPEEHPVSCAECLRVVAGRTLDPRG
jgi:hypothetical protein